MKFLLCYLVITISFYDSIFCLKINRAIVASDTNPVYLDFWPIVAKAWKQLIGVQPTLALIASPEIVVDESVGDVIRFNPIPGVPTWQQAQMIRMLLPALFKEDVCIISDIDMLPMSKKYFTDPIKNIATNRLVTYHDGMYGPLINGVPRGIPMCYVVAQGKTFAEVFGIKSIQDIERTIKVWSTGHEQNWVRDEQILREYIVAWHKITNRGVFLGYREDYVLNHRIDRGHWPVKYEAHFIRSGWFHDSHMVRPLSSFRKQISELMKLLGINL